MKNDYRDVIIKELIARGITDPDQQAGVLAQIEAESNFKPVEENLNYSAEGLVKTFSGRIPGKTKEEKLNYARKLVAKGPKAIGDFVYKDLGGYDYRGRGFIQLTGKENYKKYGSMIGEDLVKNPQKALDPQVSAKLAVVYMLDRNKKNLSDPKANTRAVAPANWESKVQERSELQKKWKSSLGGGMASSEVVPFDELAGNMDPFGDTTKDDNMLT